MLHHLNCIEDKISLSHRKLAKGRDIGGRWSLPFDAEIPQQPGGQGLDLKFSESSANAHSGTETYKETYYYSGITLFNVL